MLCNFRRSATATAANSHDVQRLFVDVFELEPIFGLCAAGYVAKVVARVLEHLAGPFLPRSGSSRQQQDEERKQKRSSHRQRPPRSRVSGETRVKLSANAQIFPTQSRQVSERPPHVVFYNRHEQQLDLRWAV